MRIIMLAATFALASGTAPAAMASPMATYRIMVSAIT